MLIFASVKCRITNPTQLATGLGNDLKVINPTWLLHKHLHLFIFVQKNTQNYLRFPIKKVYLRINIISNTLFIIS